MDVPGLARFAYGRHGADGQAEVGLKLLAAGDCHCAGERFAAWCSRPGCRRQARCLHSKACHHGLVRRDQSASVTAIAAAGLRQPLGNQAGRGYLGRGQALTALAQQAEHDVLQFVVALAIDQHAKVLVDLGHGGFDLGPALLFAVAFRDNPQNDRGPAGIDAYAGDAAAADEIGQERLDLAFARAKALDVPPQNARPPPMPRRAANR